MGKLLDNEIITVRIKNWDKFNPLKEELHNRFWVSQDIFQDIGFSRLTISGKVLWLYLLTLCSRKGRDTTEILLRQCGLTTNLRPSKCRVELLKMSDYGMLDIVTQSDHFARREEKRKEENIAQAPQKPRVERVSFKNDFEEIYREYPRKVGKKKGIERLNASIKTPEELNRFRAAVRAYTKYVAKQKIEGRYIKHFSAFVSTWEDWLDPDAGTVQNVAQPLERSF